MQRPRPVERHQIGDVDQRIDRPQAHRPQPILQPLRGGAVPDVFDQPPGKHLAHGAIHEHIDGRSPRRRRHGRNRLILERSQPRRRQVAGNPAHPGAIAAIGREPDIDHHLVDTRIIGVGHPDRRILGQFDDPVMVFGKLELGRRTQHAIGHLPPDIALADGDVLARNIGPRRGKHRFQPRPRIGRPADDVDQFARAGIDLADPQLIGIGMLFGGNHMRGNEPLERGAGIGHLLDLEPDHRQFLDDLIARSGGFQMLLEPGQREFHFGILFFVSTDACALGARVIPARGRSETLPQAPLLPWWAKAAAKRSDKGGAEVAATAALVFVIINSTIHQTTSAGRTAGSRNDPASACRHQRTPADPACRI